MKAKSATITLICLLLFGACASGPPVKKAQTDEDYYATAMEFFTVKNYFDAIPAFEEVREKFPLSPYAVLAELRLGESHYYKGEFVEAVQYFENFRRLHPSNEHVPYSIFMAGMCAYEQILSADRDPTSAREAAELFQILLEAYPTSPYAGKALCKMTEAKKRIAENEFFVGMFYYKKANYKGAVERYNKIIKEYPHSFDKEKLLFYLADATIQSGDPERGKNILGLMLKKYPEGPHSAEAKALLELHSSAAAEPKPPAP
jgi:outer membrane protein assembly factor BamD